MTAIVTRDSNCHTFEVLKRFNDEFQTFLAKLINLSSSGRQDIVDLVKNAQSIEEVCQCFDRKLTSAPLLQSCHRVLKQAEKVQFVHEVKKECLKILLKTTKTKENEVKFLMLLQTFLDEEFVASKNHNVENFQMNSEIAVKINTIKFFYFDILLKSKKALKISANTRIP